MMAMLPKSVDTNSKEAGRAEAGEAFDKVIPVPVPVPVPDVLDVVELTPGEI